MIEYIYSWIYPINTQTYNSNSNSFSKVHLISEKDLLNVKLKPIENVIPAPARNMPNLDKFTLHMLSKAQLDDILAVKLKKTEVNLKKDFYEPQHPVLRELLCKIPKIVC
jgi:hypothetical protein